MTNEMNFIVYRLLHMKFTSSQPLLRSQHLLPDWEGLRFMRSHKVLVDRYFCNFCCQETQTTGFRLCRANHEPESADVCL